MNIPVLSPIPALARYRLVAPWTFIARGHEFTVPVGYTYDGASIPSAAWYTTYSPFDPRVMVAALEHDWLVDQKPVTLSSDDAAAHFRDSLTDASPLRRELMYQAVKTFGPRWL